MHSELKKVHEIQLEMALEVKRICEKHAIKYSLIAGTLLGSIRHKGFIPWDDDLDIGMLREEYEKFVHVCSYELDSKYFLQTWESDEGFALPIAKLRRNKTKYVEKNSSYSTLHSGIYIDIFPFDNIERSSAKRIIQKNFSYILKRLLLVKMKYKVYDENEVLKKNIYKLIDKISFLFKKNKIQETLYKVMTSNNKSSSNEVVTFGGAYGFNKETIKREWLEDLTEVEFENEKFSAPLDFTGYLSRFYGDYLTPPPIDKRYNRHNIIEISFEEEN